jgi:hypothetical protein
MKQKYQLGTKKYISLRERFNLRLRILLLLIFTLLCVAGALTYDYFTNNFAPQTPTSATTVKNITFDNKYFSTSFFRFTDSEDWKLVSTQSTSNKFVFQKYLNKSDLVQHQLIVYINSTPDQLDLASSRVLPINIKEDGKTFNPSEISDHCGKSYAKGELHKVMRRQINGTALLCDPDQGQFRVVFAQIGGDYNLKLKRDDGSYANYIIIYQNQKIDPDAATLMQLAESFHST